MDGFEKYRTQMLLPGFGHQTQSIIASSRVLIIGAGGLGCPCAQFLVAAGIGHLGICDGDKVEVSNLHRQILFGSSDTGRKKTVVAQEKLSALNPATTLSLYPFFMDQQQALDIFPAYDIIVDCTDDMATRLLINDACLLLNKKLVYGAVFQYEAQLAVFNSTERQLNLRDLFGTVRQHELRSCNVSGTLGMITGIVGSLQALEVVKHLGNLPGKLENELLIYNFLSHQQYKIDMHASDLIDHRPRSAKEFLQYAYDQLCFPQQENRALDREAFLQKISNGHVQVIDVRNKDEQSGLASFASELIPLSELLQHPEKADPEKTILLFCHAGIRSQTALEFLTEECHYPQVYHLKGGLLKWEHHE